jgi:hypothetical protein
VGEQLLEAPVGEWSGPAANAQALDRLTERYQIVFDAN